MTLISVPQTSIALFFTYFVFFSGESASLIQCQISRYAKKSLLFKHLLTYMCFILFVFILDWYSASSIVPQVESTAAATTTASSEGAADDAAIADATA